FGAGKYSSRFSRYLRVLIGGHFGLMAPASLLLLGGTFLLGRLYSSEAADAFRGLLFAAAAILLFWMVRRVFYILLQPFFGVVSGALYFVFLIGGVAALKYTGRLSSATAFAAMGAAGLIASLIMLARFVPAWRAD